MFLDFTVAAALVVFAVAGTLLIQRLRGQGSSGSPKQDGAAPAGEDFQALLAAYRHHRAVVGETAKPPGPGSASTGRNTETEHGAVNFLQGSAKVLYLVLKAALPEYHVFAHARLGDVVRRADYPATVQERAQLAQARVDFVICNKDLVVVALLDLSAGTRPDDPIKQQLQPRITASGIRYVRVAPNAIPKPQDVRPLVLGGHADFNIDSTQIRLRQLP